MCCFLFLKKYKSKIYSVCSIICYVCVSHSLGVQTAVWLSFWRGFWQEYKGALCSSSLALFTENLKEKGGCVDLIKTRKLPSDLNRRAADCGCCNKAPRREVLSHGNSQLVPVCVLSDSLCLSQAWWLPAVSFCSLRVLCCSRAGQTCVAVP